MLQAIIKNGKVFPENISSPLVDKNLILIKVVSSCISAGTEMTGVKASGRSLIKKALVDPSMLNDAWNILKKKGVRTFSDRLKQAQHKVGATGYSISGIVLEVGKNVDSFEPGDHVAAAGAGYASHAELVTVPENLVMHIPAEMDFYHASSAALGGIAMQGVRRANLRIGEFCVVLGAGILGLLSIQMLRLSGIRIMAIDPDERRLQLAAKFGAEIVTNPTTENSNEKALQWSNGHGVDAVIFTAATSSNEPLSNAFKMCRRKGRVVMVGVPGPEINRSDMYAKELDYLLSTSYGPGRYDANYEEKGQDYPYAYVRWTENRNMQEFLRLVHGGKIDLSPMIDTVFPIEKAEEAFDSFENRTPKPLMILLDYGVPEIAEPVSVTHKIRLKKHTKTDKIKVALVGAGAFAKGVHLPNLKKLSNYYSLHAVMSRTGVKAKEAAQNYGANYATTDYQDILNDSDVDLIMICTRHDSHARLVIDALKAGKHVFVEKPLAVSPEMLEEIRGFYAVNPEQEKPVLMVGFNRRFSKYAVEIKRHTDSRVNPLFIHYRMNAGYIPLDHWVHEDGGRIVGEGCHIIDLMTYFTGAKLKSISSESISPNTEKINMADNKSIILKYEDGSVCTLEYFSVGSKSFPKEYMEVHFDNKTLVMSDYKRLQGYGIQVKEIYSEESDKGLLEELEALARCLIEGNNTLPITLEDLFQTTEATFIIGNL